MSDKPGKRLVIHNNAHQDKIPPAPKRLVSKGHYIITNAAKIVFGLLSVLLLVCFCLSLCLFIFCCVFPFGVFGEMSEVFFRGSGVSLILSLGAFCVCMLFHMRARTIEPIVQVTRHNTGSLPEVETLVRASDLPPSHQQAELLRAAQPVQETPPEELLRATQGSRDAER